MIPLRDNINPSDYFNLNSNQERLLFLIRYAHLAPSTRNVQPWFFHIDGDSVVVTLNKERILPHSDFVGRQVVISVGAAVYNLKVAATAYGLPFTTESAMDNLESFKVVFKFSNLETDKIVHIEDLQAILDRHNNRENYTEQALPKDFIERMSSGNDEHITTFFVEDKNKLSEITEKLVEATDVAFSNKDFSNEAADWVKPSLQKYRDGMPAYNLGFNKLVSFFLPFIIRNFNTAKPQMYKHRTWLEHSPAVAVVCTKEDNVSAWLEAGEEFEKIVLTATKENIKYAVMAALIEIGDYYKDLQKVLGTTMRPQMFFRMGYAEQKPIFTPRLAIEDVMK